ncbi:MAG: energy transducer TonB [Candidatus Didemnitutus sp.]|nr:energy transducer TonB [Candidatus Didemnitutus sp.]
MQHHLIRTVVAVALALLAYGKACSAQSTEAAAETEAHQSGGYAMIFDLHVDATGNVERIETVATESNRLSELAMALLLRKKFPEKLVDGQVVAQVIRYPLFFPVEDDLGAEANAAPMPQPILQMMPTVPLKLRKALLPGGALLKVWVDHKGRTTKVDLVRASHEDYGRAAAEAVKQWKFRPAVKDGNPVDSWFHAGITFSFELNDQRRIDPSWEWYAPPRPAVELYEVTLSGR